jgi:hypothetical protein
MLMILLRGKIMGLYIRLKWLLNYLGFVFKIMICLLCIMIRKRLRKKLLKKLRLKNKFKKRKHNNSYINKNKNKIKNQKVLLSSHLHLNYQKNRTKNLYKNNSMKWNIAQVTNLVLLQNTQNLRTCN